MSEAQLNLVVIRVLDIEAAHAFYCAIGLTFRKHAHGQGPEHYAAESGGVVFEIYPQCGSDDSTRAMRVGFTVVDVVEAISMASNMGGRVVSGPKESAWGLRAVIEDPFGHKVELLERKK